MEGCREQMQRLKENKRTERRKTREKGNGELAGAAKTEGERRSRKREPWRKGETESTKYEQGAYCRKVARSPPRVDGWSSFFGASYVARRIKV